MTGLRVNAGRYKAPDLSLTKSEIDAIHIPIDGISSGACEPRSERSWLFETLLDHNLTRESKGEEIFSTFFAHNPLKSPDSEK